MSQRPIFHQDPCPVTSVQFSHSVVSDSLRPHGLQHARLPCPSSTPGLTQTHVHRVDDAIVPFSSRLQSFPASGLTPQEMELGPVLSTGPSSGLWLPPVATEGENPSREPFLGPGPLRKPSLPQVRARSAQHGLRSLSPAPLPGDTEAMTASPDLGLNPGFPSPT